MSEFMLWDHDGVLVDTERWYFAATQESLASLGVPLDQNTYLNFMAEGRSCWDLARDSNMDGRIECTGCD
jgi:beta-phosphoglucomutase-like phosphatase (HAD superfamily)